MNSNKFTLIVAGEPNSVFLEILFKSLKKKKYKNPIILIASLDLIKLQMKKLNFNMNINILNPKDFINKKINNKLINLINVKYKPTKAFEKITSKSNKYIHTCFDVAFKIIKKYKITKFINGPINKKTFLKKKFPGITEYISQKFRIKKYSMLIYNKKLAVCPMTTHLPLKLVTKNINQKKIKEKIILIDKFYKCYLKKKPKIAVLGLNPHCESIDKYNEDDKIIRPTIKSLRNKKYNISGPYSADTIFMNNNRKQYDVILGMYHDQVLTPVKTLYEQDAINITLGLPFLRISPDHGPNEKMLGKNKSNPLSLMKAISFLDKY